MKGNRTKGAKRNSATGNKNSGRKKLSVELNFWKTLDKALPKAVSSCVKIIEDCEINLLRKNLKLTEVKSIQDTILKASGILLSKAPQRIEGTGDNNEIVFKIVGEDKYKI